MAVTARVRAFLDDLDALVATKVWPALRRDAIEVNTASEQARVVLPHVADARRTIELEVHDDLVVVQYGPERIRFTKREEALRFVEMLGDGRVTLTVHRNPVWTSLHSYRDNLARPFRKASHPWWNGRFATEHLTFGFD